MAQNRQDKASHGQWQTKRVQENPSSLHKFWQESKTRKDQLGHAPISSWSARGRERRRACGVKDILSDSTEAVQLV